MGRHFKITTEQRSVYFMMLDIIHSSSSKKKKTTSRDTRVAMLYYENLRPSAHGTSKGEQSFFNGIKDKWGSNGIRCFQY